MPIALAQPRSHRSSPAFAAQAGPAIRVSGDVDPDKVAVFTHLDGQPVTCTHGRLWLTLANDPNDYVLRPGERLVIPGAGKLVIGGRGGYTL